MFWLYVYIYATFCWLNLKISICICAIFNFSLQMVLGPFKKFYSQLTDPKYNATTDVYATMFFCDFINFLILVFGYWAFGPEVNYGSLLPSLWTACVFKQFTWSSYTCNLNCQCLRYGGHVQLSYFTMQKIYEPFKHHIRTLLVILY